MLNLTYSSTAIDADAVNENNKPKIHTQNVSKVFRTENCQAPGKRNPTSGCRIISGGGR